ncbi:PHP domain-containing protein [Lampropedia aestuarii]|uniref:PHP domain-containing protein n=1 Tax=Lampropedia aestuarii TaxID=2562762 RepID=UPI0024688D4B|nr:PHP domain-containing protein [Lampropedia aestuarii]MDH5859074.1 PHP domain-containing protein [Lampropedia aestuarii]
MHTESLQDVPNVDLHCHSTASDGVLEPRMLALRAHHNGVQIWSLTDHDTLQGQLEAAIASTELGIDYVSGVEISTLFAGRTIHIVGLGFDVTDSGLNRLLDDNRALRDERAKLMAQKLETQGFTGVLEGALRVAGSPTNLARPHFARYLVESGQADTVQGVFERWLGDGKSCFVATDWVSMGAAIAAIHAAGGTAVLAHPLAYGLKPWELDVLLTAFQQAGGEAIEVVSGARLSHAEIKQLASTAVDMQFTASRGSDFHLPEEGGGDLGLVPNLPKRLRPVWHKWLTKK